MAQYDTHKTSSHANSVTQYDACMSCVLHTSLDDKRNSIGSGMNDLECIPVTHAIRLMTIDTHNPVIYLANK